MSFSALSSKEVLAFLPLNTWTEIILISSTFNKNGIYICTTKQKMEKRLQDMVKISYQSDSYEQIKEFKHLDIVAVEIDGKWFRGKLISFNEYQSNDTRIELIDIGTFHETKLKNVFALPYFYLYEPLALPIKFKNFIPNKLTDKLSVKPLLSESLLYEGVVLVDVNSNNVKSINDDNTYIEKQQSNLEKPIYLSKSFRRGSFNNKPKTYDIPFKSGDVCMITYFEDFTCLYVCKAKKNDQHSYELINENIPLMTLKSEDKIPKLNPVVGDVVKVYSSQHNGLFRAKVLKNDNNGSYEVFYIDYGNKETIPSNLIYELADELKKPGLAVKVGMNDLNHIKCTKEIHSMFHQYCEAGKPFVIEFDETSKNCLESIKLKDEKDGTYINTKFLSTKSESSSETHINTSNVLINELRFKQLNTCEYNDTVYLKYFDDMANIYVLKDVQLYNEVMLRMIEDSNSDVCKKNFNVGDIVKVISEKCTYRARIKHIDGDLINVINIDLGYCEIVSSDSIYELSENLKEIPRLTIKVGIKEPTIKKTEELNNVIDKVQQIPLYIQFDKDNPNRYQNVTLIRKDNSKNIFDEIFETIKHKLVYNDISKINNETICHTKDLSNGFQSISLKTGDSCFVSYFKDFENIYLCKAIKEATNDSFQMHNFGVITETWNNKDRKIKTNPAIGNIVKVFSPYFQDFYRAKILNIVNNNEFHVSYIDFGNVEIVHLNDIFELEHELSKEFILPIRVSIDVPPNSKVTDEIEMFFTNLIDNNTVLSIEFKTKRSTGVENVFLKELKSECSVNEKVLKFLSVEKLCIKNGDSCVISHFENLNCIYVSKVHEPKNASFLKDIMCSTDRLPVTNPVIGDIVKVYSSLFQAVYRAKILNIIDNDIHVFHIDFGSKEVVNMSNIFELSDMLKEKHELAIKIGINMPCSIEINQEITDMFFDLAEKMEVLIIEFDESSKICLDKCILKVKSSGLNINNEVLKLLPNNVSVSSKNVESLELKTEEHLTKSPDIMNNTIKSLKNREIVILRYFQDSSSVFVSKGSKEHSIQFDYVIEKTAQDETTIKKLNIKLGDIVKGIFDSYMYRATVLKKVDEDHYQISFIDFGNKEIVHVDDLFELPDELKKIPSLCYQIGIKGSPNIEKNEIVENYFNNLEIEPLYIEYDENNPNGLREASLKKNNNSDIFEELLKILDKSSNQNENSVKKSQNGTENVNEKKMPINSVGLEIISNNEMKSGDIVFCCHFEDLNNIYLCKSYTHIIKPENSKLIIEFSKVKDKNQKKNPTFGNIVGVQFENKLYRGRVIEKFGEMYTVLLMDIGKKISVAANNLYEIPKELQNIPDLVKRVGLKRITHFNITKNIKDYFNCLWNTGPIPLILIYDESNFNCMNEVSLKKQSDGCDIVEDLLKLSNSSNNVCQTDKLKSSLQYSKCNGSINNRHLNNEEHVEFLFGTNVETIYIRHTRLYEEFKNILEQLKNEKRENLKPLVPKQSDIVAVYSSTFEELLRGRVISIDGHNMIKCVMVDTGHIESIKSIDVFTLPNQFVPNKIPIFVHKVKLNGLNKSHHNSKISAYLHSMNGKTCIIEFEKNSNQWYKHVILKELNSNVSINDKVQQLLSTISPTSTMQHRLEKKIVMYGKNESEKPSHPITSGSSVFITHFDDFNSIFIRDASYDFIEKFKSFNIKMIKYFRNVNNNHKKEQLNIGDKVCVKSSINMIMYSRARIVEILGDQYNVFYLDYGNTELVDSEDIFELPTEFEKIQDFVIKVQLQNMPSLQTINESQVIKEYFIKQFITRQVILTIEFNEVNPKGLDDVILKRELCNKNITDNLKELMNAPLIIKSTELNQNAEEQSKVQNSSSHIYPYPARKHNKLNY